MRRDAHRALLSVEHEMSRWERERAEDGAEGYLFPEMGREREPVACGILQSKFPELEIPSKGKSP